MEIARITRAIRFSLTRRPFPRSSAVTECACRAGQSIRVLFRYYAKFLAEARHHANRLIEDSMRRRDERGDDAAAR